MVKNINFLYYKYLSNIDFCHKYNCNQINTIINCSKIHIDILIKHTNSSLHYKFFILFFFLLYGKMPTIMMKKLSKSKKLSDIFVKLRLTLTNYNEIYNFLHLFFLEKWTLIKEDNFHITSRSLQKKLKYDSMISCISLSFYTYLSSEYYYFKPNYILSNKTLISIFLRENILFYFKFSNNKKLNFKNTNTFDSLLNCIPFFWLV
tara:strand:+ start:14318 stop:14932 length:615 start_codon:yes stop_codon:yes gene_type:complete